MEVQNTPSNLQTSNRRLSSFRSGFRGYRPDLFALIPMQFFRWPASLPFLLRLQGAFLILSLAGGSSFKPLVSFLSGTKFSFPSFFHLILKKSRLFSFQCWFRWVHVSQNYLFYYLCCFFLFQLRFFSFFEFKGFSFFIVSLVGASN